LSFWDTHPQRDLQLKAIYNRDVQGGTRWGERGISSRGELLLRVLSLRILIRRYPALVFWHG
jgi:hypothetical protein